jgi:hypothetical protein
MRAGSNPRLSFCPQDNDMRRERLGNTHMNTLTSPRHTDKDCSCGHCILCRTEELNRKRMRQRLERLRAFHAKVTPKDEPKYWFVGASASPVTRCENFRCRELVHVRDMRLIPRMIQVPAKGFEQEWREAQGAAKANIPTVQILVQESLCPACVAKRDSKGGKVFTSTARPTPAHDANAQLHALAQAQRQGFASGELVMGRGQALGAERIAQRQAKEKAKLEAELAALKRRLKVKP